MKWFFILFLIYKVTYGGGEKPLVILPLGPVLGYTRYTASNRSIHTFEGVPFAQPPIGENRFEKPIPIKPWKGIWIAKSNYVCMQYHQYIPPGKDPIIGDEDCLYLNIYTPTLQPTANLDVIVYIHGGGFMFGSNRRMKPEPILDREDLVYVSCNYRVGPLGFLSTEDDTIPANNGLRDQTLALKFINKYIKYFGGNPDSITLLGLSAGGASVNFHYMIEASRGLFHRGISSSGTVLNPWVLMENPLEMTQNVAHYAGCPNDNSKQMIDCLKGKTAKQIVSTVKEFQPWLYNPFSPFAVVVDEWSKDPVLPAHPYEILKNKNIWDVPWIIAHMTSEGLYPGSDFYSNERLKYINDNWSNILPHILHYNFTVKPDLKNVVSETIRNYYFDKRDISKETFSDLLEMLSDRLYLVDIEKTIRLQAEAMKSPIYAYYFTYIGGYSLSKLDNSNVDYGASHGADNMYIFQSLPNVSVSENDQLVSKLLLDIIISFTKYGKPDVPSEWPNAIDGCSNSLQFLEIQSHRKLHIHSRKSIGNRLFWDTLPIIENEKLFNTEKKQ